VLLNVSTGTSTLASTVTGSGFTKQGTGTLVLTASNTFGSGTMTFGAGSSTNLGYITLSNGKALGNYSTINLAGNNTAVAGLNLTGDITANYALRLDGRTNNSSTYHLKNVSGNNTWAGNITSVNTGGSYLFVSDSGTLTLSGTQNSTVTSSRGFVYSGAGAITITGPLLNGGTAGISVTKSGAGTLTLSGNNTYAQGTTVSGGTVRVMSNTGLGTGAVTVAGAGTVVLDGVTVSNTFTVNGGSLLGGSITAARLVGTSSGTVSSTLTGTGGLTKSGTTRLALTGTSTFTGTTLVSGGTLALGNAVALQNSGFDTASTGVVQLAAGSSLTLGGVVGGGAFAPTGYSSITSLTLNAQPGSTFTYSGNLANGAAGMSLTKTGSSVALASAPGIQVLSGTSLYTGPTSITGGVLQFTKPSALYGGDRAKWTAANLTTGAGGALAVNVGGAGEFTLADVAMLLALSSGSDGFLPGAAIGIDTSNAGGSLTYAAPLVDGNGGANRVVCDGFGRRARRLEPERSDLHPRRPRRGGGEHAGAGFQRGHLRRRHGQHDRWHARGQRRPRLHRHIGPRPEFEQRLLGADRAGRRRPGVPPEPVRPRRHLGRHHARRWLANLSPVHGERGGDSRVAHVRVGHRDAPLRQRRQLHAFWKRRPRCHGSGQQ